MKRTVITALVTVVSALACYAQSQYVSSTKGNVNLRTSPSTTAPKAGTLAAADLATLIEEVEAPNGNWDDGWYKVDVNGTQAYVSRKVATTVEATIPKEMYNKMIDSNEGADKIRFQGYIEIVPVDKAHAIININWMRVNLPAEEYCYIADIKDGKIIATHRKYGSSDASEGLSAIMEAATKLDKPIPVGFSEFNNTLLFNGIEYSEFE